MTLTGLAVRIGMLWHQQELIVAQQRLIKLLREQRNREQLNHLREIQGLVSAWLICLETPEIDLRDELAQMETHLQRDISVLEEHIL